MCFLITGSIKKAFIVNICLHFKYFKNIPLFKKFRKFNFKYKNMREYDLSESW